MVFWRRRRAQHLQDEAQGPPLDQERAQAALVKAQQSLVRAQAGRAERAPVWAEAERHIARNGIYDDLARGLRLKGSSP